MSRKHVFGLILVAMVLATVELISFAGIKWVQRRTIEAGQAGVFWDAARFTNEQVQEAFSTRDELLAWPGSGQLASSRYDAAGARRSPAFPDPDQACVAAFGDSFTYSEEVSDEDAWTNRLAERIGCRVANYGVSGYGVDQAYLRYQRVRADLASTAVVVIGLFPENIMRHVNQYVGFREGRPNLIFKPRFVLESGSLRLYPPLSRGRFDLKQLNERPAELLPHEFFLPDSQYGPVSVRFPHALSLVRALLHPRVRAILSRNPSWVDFYREGIEPSEPLALTKKLIETFVGDVEASGKTALVVVFTNPTSVDVYVKKGRWPFQSILDFMDQRGIEHLNVGSRLAEKYGSEQVCDIFTLPLAFGCTGHYRPEGYAIVAQMIAEHLRSKHLLDARR